MIDSEPFCVLLLEAVKPRGIIDEQLSLAVFTDIVAFDKHIDRVVQAVSVRNVGAVNPALVAELFDCERQQFFIHLEAEINLAALDVFLGQTLPGVAAVKINPARAPGKPLYSSIRSTNAGTHEQPASRKAMRKFG